MLAGSCRDFQACNSGLYTFILGSFYKTLEAYIGSCKGSSKAILGKQEYDPRGANPGILDLGTQ